MTYALGTRSMTTWKDTYHERKKKCFFSGLTGGKAAMAVFVTE
jgi:hypothetical protein